MSIAITAAEMGILVMGTLHTNGAAPDRRPHHQRVSRRQAVARAHHAVHLAARRDLAAAAAEAPTAGPRRGARDPGQHLGRGQPDPPGQARPAREHHAVRRRQPACAPWTAPSRRCSTSGIDLAARRPTRRPSTRPASRPSRIRVEHALRRTPILVTSALPYANGPLHLGHIIEAVQTDIWVPLPAPARQRLPLRLRRGLPRHADHDPRAAGGHHARGADRARRPPSTSATTPASTSASTTSTPRTREENRRYSDELYERCVKRGSIARRTRPPGLRRAGRHVPAGPLRARHLPALRHAGPVRRLLRELRRHLLAGRPEGCRLHGHRHARRCCATPSTCSSGSASSSRTCATGWPAHGLQPAVRAKLDEWFEAGLQDWDISRDAPYFGFEIPGRARQVFLRLVRCADRLHRQLRGAGREARPRFRRVLEGRRQHRTAPLHRQGHQLLPHAVLAGGAAWRGLPPPDRRARARLPDRQRPEDVEVARHLHHRAPLPGPAARRPPALLLRRQARPRPRRHRPEPRRLHRAREFRPGRQAREHRQPLRAASSSAAAAAWPRRCPIRRCMRSSPRPPSRIAALFEARDYAGAMREIMVLADRANQYVDEHKPWVLAKDPAQARRGRAMWPPRPSTCSAC